MRKGWGGGGEGICQRNIIGFSEFHLNHRCIPKSYEYQFKANDGNGHNFKETLAQDRKLLFLRAKFLIINTYFKCFIDY